MGIFICHVYRLTKRVNAAHVDAETQSKAKVKIGTTALHMFTLILTTLAYFEDVYTNYSDKFDTLVYNRTSTVVYFFAGFLDIFVSFMLWFMMDRNTKPLYIENRNHGELYQVLDVINP